MYETAVLLHNIRSAHNVGSIFRTADGAGLSKVYVSGYSAQPIDKHGKVQPQIAKTALGAEKMLPWEYQKNPYAIIKKLRAQGWKIVGVELDKRSVDYRSFELDAPTLFLLGNEVRGLSPAMRKKCDVLLKIPMRGKKESLNVSVAAGIIFFSSTK